MQGVFHLRSRAFHSAALARYRNRAYEDGIRQAGCISCSLRSRAFHSAALAWYRNRAYEGGMHPAMHGVPFNYYQQLS